MKILKTNDYVGEKLNIKPIEKANLMQTELGETEYVVVTQIHGVASVKVKAKSPSEAVKIAKEKDDWGSNDYFWMGDMSKIAVIESSAADTDPSHVVDKYDVNFDNLRRDGWLVMDK